MTAIRRRSLNHNISKSFANEEKGNVLANVDVLGDLCQASR